MEFNLNLSTTVMDIVNYFRGNSDNSLGEMQQGMFGDIVEGLFGDSDESEDIDYNLILNLLNNLKIFNAQEDLQNINQACAEQVYNELDKVEDLSDAYNSINETQINVEGVDYKANTNLLSDEELEILSNLKNNFENEYIMLNNKTRKIELSDKEIEVLKKLDNLVSNKANNIVLKNENNVISKNKVEENSRLFQTNKLDNINLDKSENKSIYNPAYSEKFSQLENNNTTDKLNLIRDDELNKDFDKDLDTLESILNEDKDNNFILNNNQLPNKDINSINANSRQEVATIRQEYIGEDIIKTVKYLKSSGKEEMTIKISPRELGDMTIKLINNHDKASLAITISKADVFNLVNDNQGEIAKHLKDLNINIKEISIDIKGDTQNNFSSNLSQEFHKNNNGSKQRNKKIISSMNESTEDIEEVDIEDNVNILV